MILSGLNQSKNDGIVGNAFPGIPESIKINTPQTSAGLKYFRNLLCLPFNYFFVLCGIK